MVVGVAIAPVVLIAAMVDGVAVEAILLSVVVMFWLMSLMLGGGGGRGITAVAAAAAASAGVVVVYVSMFEPRLSPVPVAAAVAGAIALLSLLLW